MKKTVAMGDQDAWDAVAALVRGARKVVALTGAGISVGSGIPDFRSPGGLWSIYSPEEYATLDVFHRNPTKAWQLFRALGKVLVGKKPNPAHRALAEMETIGLLAGIVTQNIDNLHQQAGSRRVFEIHGDHQHLQCIHCDILQAVEPQQYQAAEIPLCEYCTRPLKPNVVLFGEPVRDLEAIHQFVGDCDLLLVIGTSAQVYPAAALPSLVRERGGCLFEFNRDSVLEEEGGGQSSAQDHWFFPGDVCQTLPRLVDFCGRQ
ncbi:MAG: NAD-dependent deacylase [Desulfobulbus sp.]|nr:NAD-dependent deacylase [Desulfobulbus sp.]